MKRKSIITVSVILLAIVLVIVFMVFRHKKDSIAWKASPIRKGKITILVKATGTLNADTTVQVGTQVTGIVWKLFADYNSKVKKGQVIAVIDTTFLSASRATAQAALQSAQANLQQAQWTYDRDKILLNEKVIAASDFETAETNLAVARASEVSAQANLNHALINLQYAVITAPVTGTVISRDVELGQTVVSSFNSVTLFSIANDLTKMQVQADVDEADIGQVKVGQPVTFTVDAYPDEVFQGTVRQVRLQPVTVQNVVNYIVIIDVSNKDLKLMPGMTANISINVQEHDNILKVPANALSFTPPQSYIKAHPSIAGYREMNTKNSREEDIIENSGAFVEQTSGYVWVVRGDLVHPVKVKLGLSDGNYTEIESDSIRPREWVATGVRTGSYTSGGPSTSPFMPQFHRRK
ncbi:MAG: efflux RND transporter periplasmic adaptor subunit [Bacteroidales bacterium]|nr:efflux RND transporter periplasmic adaptor subunit [Bacteroidales bacterium]